MASAFEDVAQGVRVRRDWVVDGSYDVDSGEAAMRKLLLNNSRSLPTVPFVTTVAAAVGAVRVAWEASLQVPDDLSIVSVHDFWFAEHTAPPLTTLRTPQFALRVVAMRALADRINGHDPAHIVVDEPTPELIRRGSTAPPRRRPKR
jgi:LacI family transcriptional regulator